MAKGVWRSCAAALPGTYTGKTAQCCVARIDLDHDQRKMSTLTGRPEKAFSSHLNAGALAAFPPSRLTGGVYHRPSQPISGLPEIGSYRCPSRL